MSGQQTIERLEEDLGYLIERVKKVGRGGEKFVDARVRPLNEAIHQLNNAKRLLSAALVISPE